jgi:hypothetical protein
MATLAMLEKVREIRAPDVGTPRSALNLDPWTDCWRSGVLK